MQEERSADESAVKYLNATKQSPLGLKNFMKKIQNTNKLSGYEEVPYFRTHPLSREREEFFNVALKNSTYESSSPLDKKFNIVKAKLTAFLLDINHAQKLYPKTDTSVAGKYANAIIEYRKANYKKAINILDELIRKEPDNPYFYELKGQFLFESGQVKSAVTEYEKALKIKPDSKDFMLSWAHALLEAPHNKQDLQEIINTLNKVQIKSPSSTAWLLLARAYEEGGQNAYMLYASAQYSLAMGNTKIAKKQIDEAIKNASEPLKLKINDLKIPCLFFLQL